jgi:disulfide bond formation protein DsbB
VLWRFLGLSIAEWALICFAIFLVAAIVAAAMKPKRLRMFGP